MLWLPAMRKKTGKLHLQKETLNHLKLAHVTGGLTLTCNCNNDAPLGGVPNSGQYTCAYTCPKTCPDTCKASCYVTQCCLMYR